MIGKICLGTAQFGLNYGFNHHSMVAPGEVYEILNYVYGHGVKILDTADNYGQSEHLIGSFQEKTKKQFHVISKFSSHSARDFHKIIKNSLENLKIDKLHGCLIHNFSFYQKHPKIGNMLNDYKKKGIIKKIGFSLYYPKEALHILENHIPCDIMQIPFNIFDQRFAFLLKRLKNRAIKVFARSVFLQGLLLGKPENLPAFFNKIKKPLADLRKISQNAKIPMPAICAGFVLTQPLIDKVIIGVSSLANLKENLKVLDYIKDVKKINQDLAKFCICDEDIIVPLRWQAKKI